MAGIPACARSASTIGVIALGAKMARADGDVSEVERAAFRDFFEVPPGEEANVERFFDLAKRDAGGFETYARQVAALFPDAPEILENVIEGLFSIAQADGRIDVAEADYLAKVANIFGLPSSRFERAKAAALGAGGVRTLRRAGHRSDGGPMSRSAKPGCGRCAPIIPIGSSRKACRKRRSRSPTASSR
jgi:uncharacterized tellurite resistance protein B-like protein